MSETPEAKAERRRREMEKKRIKRSMASPSSSSSAAISPSRATLTTSFAGPSRTEVKSEYHHNPGVKMIPNMHSTAVVAREHELVMPQVAMLATQQHQQQINVM